MSEAKYDGEASCAVCVFFEDTPDFWECYYGDTPMFDHVAPHHVCEFFHPTITHVLQCRQVRALEMIADHFCIAAEVRIGLAKDAAVGFGDGRCMQCNGTGIVNKGMTGEGACYDCNGSGKIV
jgi:hypothetical protein